MGTVTLNPQQRLFVIPSGGGYSCLGFDVAFKRLRQYAQLLGLAAPDPEKVGTLEQYREYETVSAKLCAARPQQTIFDPETAPEVQRLLEHYRVTREPVRIFYGCTETGRDWLDEYDVYGTIGRSTGPIKVPLMVSARSSGGPAILSACIVRMVDGKTKRQVYRHPLYQMPLFKVQESTEVKDLPFEVLVNGAVHARFTKEARAQAWVEFMRGERMKK